MTNGAKELMAQLPEHPTTSSESERPYKSARLDADSRAASKRRPTNARQPLRTCYERLPEDCHTTKPKNQEPPTNGIAKASRADKSCCHSHRKTQRDSPRLQTSHKKLGRTSKQIGCKNCSRSHKQTSQPITIPITTLRYPAMKRQPITRMRLRWIKSSPVATLSKINYQYHLTSLRLRKMMKMATLPCLMHHTTPLHIKTINMERRTKATTAKHEPREQPNQQAEKNCSTTKGTCQRERSPCSLSTDTDSSLSLMDAPQSMTLSLKLQKSHLLCSLQQKMTRTSGNMLELETSGTPMENGSAKGHLTTVT